MRLSQVRDGAGVRLVAASGGEWVRPGDLIPDANFGSLSELVAAGPPAWRRLADAVRPGDEPNAEPTSLAPLLDPSARIFCIGRNYVEHVNEFANNVTPWPEVFLRLASTVIGPAEDILLPSVTQALDFEGELGVIIGVGGRHIAADDALEHVFGYTIANDVTARDWQRRGGQWTSGKNFDGTLPVGPSVVTADQLDATDLALTTRVNGEVMQSARTSQFIFDLGAQIEFVSSFTELRPGDLICTGTPGGVGMARKPPVLLADGDVVEVEVEGIGAIRNRVRHDGLQAATARWQDVLSTPKLTK